MSNTFQEQKKKEYTRKTRTLVAALPMVCGAYFRSIESQTSVLTRYAYAVDLTGFFAFAAAQEDLFPGKPIPSLTAGDLEKIKAYHIELYLYSISLYQKGEREFVNQ